MAKQNVQLPKEVAEKYELVNYGPGSARQRWGKYGVIDIDQLTLEKADRLYKSKWPKLALKEQGKTAPPPAGDGGKKK